MQKVIWVGKEDKAAIMNAMKSVGIKARIKMLSKGLRLVIDGKHEEAVNLLNDNGYTNGGIKFEMNSFNQREENYGEIFIHHKYI